MSGGENIRIGYACICLGVPFTEQKSCTQKNATPDKLTQVIRYNLGSLENILEYNLENGIRLFRISSDLIPFGSSPANTLNWAEHFAGDLSRIGKRITEGGMRVSMHPGQYTVLNSPDEGVVTRAMEDLVYHCRVLDVLGVGKEHKIILHVGGVYGDKASALARFQGNYERLEASLRQRLVIENDDRCFNIEDTLILGRSLGIPVVFDNLHHRINPAAEGTESDWIAACGSTWKEGDGPQKIHYAQQEPDKKPGSHSRTIRIDEFLEFYQGLKGDLDLMLETKDKNLSAVKCLRCTDPNMGLAGLEKEWARYKYLVLEHSPSEYLEIRKLFGSREGTPPDFYRLIESALSKERHNTNSVNAAQHVWGYVKDLAAPAEKKVFLQKLQAFSLSKLSLSALKAFLQRMADRYHQGYLTQSYYFLDI